MRLVHRVSSEYEPEGVFFIIVSYTLTFLCKINVKVFQNSGIFISSLNNGSGISIYTSVIVYTFFLLISKLLKYG